MTQQSPDVLRSEQNLLQRLQRLQLIPPLTGLLAVLSAFAPLTHGDAMSRVGFLLVITAFLEMMHGFRRARPEQQKSAWGSGAISLGLGVLLMNAPLFAYEALRLFLAGWFLLDAARSGFATIQGADDTEFRRHSLLLAAMNLIIAVIVYRLSEYWLTWPVALVASFRIFSIAGTMSQSQLMTFEMLSHDGAILPGVSGDEQVQLLARRLAVDEAARTAVDRGWILVLLATLLAIHVGRMGFDRTFLGLMSPGFAVVSDMFAALLLSFLIVIPLIVASNRLIQRLESFAWRWCLDRRHDRFAPIRDSLQWLLTVRMRQIVRLRQARCSFAMALSRGLQTGLPLAAIIAATAPVWGMSWYFDTENWAAGIWNSWAEHRTDTWRTAMVDAVPTVQGKQSPSDLFAVSPEGVTASDDFSFVVIGDPGEGDASQLSLKSQLLSVVNREDVRFVVISSDVVYPTGAMKDYETNFWLPFMGTKKPVYAIPGNHDWYDALEGFAATFFEPDAARAAMRARVEVDNRLTSTTDAYIERLIDRASFLQREYQIPVQKQRAPYFQVQTAHFALMAVDTGVARRIDSRQQQWLEEALKAAGDKMKMVILGHPFFAGGLDQTITTEHKMSDEGLDFAGLRKLLADHDVSVVMGGDTHDLEYYREDRSQHSTIHHFVNGGGGAYLSFGTALDWPKNPVTSEWAFFPNRKQVVDKIEANTPIWKRPAWIWTKRLGGWPFSAEWLSAAFDSNTAPFYQSFIEVKVEPSKRQLRLIPYGIHGQLRRSDFQQSSTDDTEILVEWIIPM